MSEKITIPSDKIYDKETIAAINYRKKVTVLNIELDDKTPSITIIYDFCGEERSWCYTPYIDSNECCVLAPEVAEGHKEMIIRVMFEIVDEECPFFIRDCCFEEKLAYKWLFMGLPVRDATQIRIDDYEGFVYVIIHNTTYKTYIGKKSFWSRSSKSRRVVNESKWEDYYGSSKELLADVKKYGKENFTREILYLCETKDKMAYIETSLHFMHNVLEDDRFYNKTIGGKFFKHYYTCRKLATYL